MTCHCSLVGLRFFRSPKSKQRSFVELYLYVSVVYVGRAQSVVQFAPADADRSVYIHMANLIIAYIYISLKKKLYSSLVKRSQV